MKDSKKGKVASNYKPKACFLIMQKLLTGIIGDDYLESHLERSGLLQNEQKDCCRGSRGTKDQRGIPVVAD